MELIALTYEWLIYMNIKKKCYVFIYRMLPKKASFMLRDLLDTGVDFG